MLDFIKIPLSIDALLHLCGRLTNYQRNVPTFVGIGNGSFIDTTINIFNEQTERNQIILLLMCIFLTVIYASLNQERVHSPTLAPN